MNNLLKTALPHLLALLVFLVITLVYFSPVLDGKTIEQPDIVQAKGAAQEANQYRQKTGSYPFWTNSMFGGMPTYLIASDYPNSWTTKAGRFFVNLLPDPANYLLLYLVGFYILLVALGLDAWLAALGAIGFAFGSYNLINIEAGHASKVIAVGFMPPILAGVILAYRGRYWLGGALAGLFLGMQLYGNHVQITFYMFLAIGLYALMEFVFALREKRLKTFLFASAVLALASALAVGSHASRLLTTNEYSKESIRGKSELTAKPAAGAQNAANANGLDYEYAFRWSYGKAESFTLLVPHFSGGGSMMRGLGKNSALYDAVIAQGASDAQARQFAEQMGSALYWGEQQMGTGGPAYAGAVVIFLFVLGLFVIKDRIKWWLLASAVLMLMLAWGRHFILNDWLFHYAPFFDKFRAVTMTLTLVQVYLAFGAALAVDALLRGNHTWATLKKPLAWSLGLTAGLALVFAVLGGAFFDFRNEEVDKQLSQAYGDWVVKPLRDDRASALQGDAFRSFLFIVAAAGVLLAFVFKRLNATMTVGLLALVVLVDMFAVDKRYLNNDKFTVTRRDREREYIQLTPADQQIMQDTTHYRVLNYSVNPFNDASTSYFHASIGGYHGAKMRRYQDVIDSLLAKGKINVLNMLNTKYVIVPDQKTQQLQVQSNGEALGNAWFVRSYKIVPNADAELAALDTLNARTTALVDARFADQLKGFEPQPDSTATIRLVSYSPDVLVYQSNAAMPQLAVFSEMYYANKDYWQAEVDGKPVPHFRANYILRGMVVPAGSHKITFRFVSNTYRQGEQIALFSSIGLFAFLGVAVFFAVRSRQSVVSGKS
ncbi:MAG: YfhO family protein [Cytophagales bacterium]|nr:YfhO family protein [Cytophagales bacterium]